MAPIRTITGSYNHEYSYREAVEIASRKGNAVLMPTEEYAAWQETAYLFRSPANARRLLDSYERARAGEV